MEIAVTIILSILIVMFVLVLVKNDLLKSLGKIILEIPLFVRIILYLTIIGCFIYIIVTQILRFK